MALFHDSVLAGSSGRGVAGYKIERSLRFNSSDSAFCSRVFPSAGNRKKWTLSLWVKRSGLGQDSRIFSAATSGSNQAGITFNTDNTIEIFDYQGSYGYRKVTAQVFRDTSAWYHLLLAADFDNATAEDRLQFYVNGSRVTAFSTNTNPSSGYSTGLVNSAVQHGLGAYTGPAALFNGYLADVIFIDAQQLTPSSLVEVSATTGRLEPKAYSGPTPTGNSFWLPFSDNSAATATTLGKDNFNLGNNWTPNNVSISTGGPTSVAAASGALPVYNTTDTYGTTKGTGTRTDANASSLSLAVPMDGTNGGTTFTDESATIRGSGSAKTVTPTLTSTSTARSKYYGSSGLFSAGRLTIPTSTDLNLTGDFTLEAWVYIPSSSPSIAVIWDTSANGNAASLSELYYSASAIAFYPGANIVSGTIPGFDQWFHVAVTRAGSTTRIFIGGILQQTSTTTYSVITGQAHYIGDRPPGAVSANYPFAGNIQDFRIYKGVAKYTSNFNPPTATQDTALAAGNDSLVDTPTSGSQVDTGLGGQVTGNYCTLNPLASAGTFSNGNLEVSVGSSAETSGLGTFGLPASGKWHWEVAMTTVGTDAYTGIASGTSRTGLGSAYYAYRTGGSFAGTTGSTPSSGASYTTGDIIGVAYDATAATLAFYKNGSLQGTFTGIPVGLYFPLNYAFNTAARTLNFGQRPFAYTAPSGFKALCDTNLPAPVVAKPSTVMDVKLYTGNGSTQTISGLGFSPDLVWIKGRSGATDHALYDAVRGTQARLESNTTDAEATSDSGLTAFNSDGFALSTLAQVNTSSATYAAWTWDAGSTTVTNTQGSITSSVRANPSAGFSIVTYTGNATAGATVGHGLGVAPQFIIVKNRATSPTNWSIYHVSIGATKRLTFTTATEVTINSIWNNTTPGSSVFTLGDSSGVNETGISHVAYCFAPVAGYSAFGSYTGNGSVDGPLVYTGFRPRWVMIKASAGGATQWFIYDTARNTSNVGNFALYASDATAETSILLIDLLSNGFKLRYADTGGYTNYAGWTYIYAAFAESPFAYSRAR